MIVTEAAISRQLSAVSRQIIRLRAQKTGLSSIEGARDGATDALLSAWTRSPYLRVPASGPVASWSSIDYYGHWKRSRNVFLFDRVRRIALPFPTIQKEVTGTEGNYSLNLESAVLARHVYVSFGDNDVAISDNYFDLLPNESVRVMVKTNTNVDEVRRSLNVRNITDAFLADEAK